jgi:hypothetical protein
MPTTFSPQSAALSSKTLGSFRRLESETLPSLCHPDPTKANGVAGTLTVRLTVVAKRSSLTIAKNRLGYQQSLALASNLSLSFTDRPLTDPARGSWNATVALSGPYLDNVLGRPVKRKCILPASQRVIMSEAAKIMVAGSRKLLIRKQQQNCFPGRNQASAVPEVWYGVRAVRGR